MNKDVTIKLLTQFLNAHKKQDVLNRALGDAFEAFDNDNTFFGLTCFEMSTSIDELLKQLLGNDNFEWLMWYQWDADYGTKNQNVIIDDVKYNIDSVEMLVNHCFQDIP